MFIFFTNKLFQEFYFSPNSYWNDSLIPYAELYIYSLVYINIHKIHKIVFVNCIFTFTLNRYLFKIIKFILDK